MSSATSSSSSGGPGSTGAGTGSAGVTVSTGTNLEKLRIMLTWTFLHVFYRIRTNPTGLTSLDRSQRWILVALLLVSLRPMTHHQPPMETAILVTVVLGSLVAVVRSSS
jgi:hypothetical protein